MITCDALDNFLLKLPWANVGNSHERTIVHVGPYDWAKLSKIYLYSESNAVVHSSSPSNDVMKCS